MDTWDYIDCPTLHLIDDCISVDPEVLSNEEICSLMIDSKKASESCMKACCAFILLRNVKLSIELLLNPSNDRYYLRDCMINCLAIQCIYMSEDLVKLSLEILDLAIDRYGICDDDDGDTILHGIAYCLNSPSDGCCNDKWLSFLRKIVDRVPVDILSMQDSIFRLTPYDCLIQTYCQDEEVLEILKPR